MTTTGHGRPPRAVFRVSGCVRDRDYPLSGGNMSKVLLLAVGVAGYVLGARDGRQHYEQLRAGAQRI